MVSAANQSIQEPPWRDFPKEVFLFTTEALRTQREFFAYREGPIGEDCPSTFPNSTGIHLGSKHFCLSVSPDKQKVFSVPSVSPW